MSKRVRFGVVAGFVAAALGATTLVVLNSKADFAELPELVQARESGKPVEVLARHTQVQRTWANPDGSFRREYSAFPKWMKTSNGWEDVDYTLAESNEGTLSPKAAPGNVEFGGGEDTFLMSMTADGVKVALSWTDELPVPTIKGSTATYADVLTDVDLKLTVDVGGPSQVLVVKNAAAAANPALRKIVTGAKVSGGIIAGSDGGMRVLDARGREVAVAPRPQMWDSSGDVVDLDMKPVTGAAADEARVSGPGRDDLVAAVKLDVDPDRLTLSPAESLLQGDDVTYPVFIDPQISPPKYDWAMVSLSSPNTEYYKWSNTNQVQWVGSPGSGYKQRLFWKFDVTDLNGSNLTKATLTARARGTANCSTHYVSVWRTNQIATTTNWNNQPSTLGSELGVRSATTGSSCTYKTRAMEFDVEPGVQAAANANVKVTLRMTADDESSTSGWAWIDRDATLSIVYVFDPEKPAELELNDPDKDCLASPSAVTIGALAPRVSATVPSLELDNDNLRMQFQAFSGDEATGTAIWDEEVSVDSKSGAGTVLSGTRFVSATRVDNAGAPLEEGDYAWRARAVKANDSSNTGPWSNTCVFNVSPNLLSTPGVDVPGGTEWGVDKSTTVTLTPMAADSEALAKVASYRWSLNSTSAKNLVSIPAETLATTKNASATITPDRAGPNVLRVWAYDVHGNRSLPKVMTLDTTAGVGTFTARYLFNAQPDAAAIFDDAVGTNHLVEDLDLLVDRGTYRIETDPDNPVADEMLHFTGADDPVTSDATTVDTSEAFTVSAWVDPQLAGSNPMGDMTAISQGTTTQSSFVLGVGPCTPSAPAVKCYRFGVRGTSGITYVTSNTTVIQNSLPGDRHLVHLIGSVTATGKARLYVFANGIMDKSTATLTAPIAGTGPLVIGAEVVGSGFASKWIGNIDDITVMAGVLDSPGAVQLHAKDSERCYVERENTDDGLELCAN